MNTLKDYIDKFKGLNVYRPRTGERGRPEAPNKPCMLLAAIDLAERGRLIENRIRFEDTWEAYGAYAAAIEPAYTLNSYDPFYYLGKEDFWHLSPKDEFKPSANKLLDRGMTASLDPELYELLCGDPEARAALREVLVERWFHDIPDRVEEIVRERGIQHSLERRLTLERTQRENLWNGASTGCSRPDLDDAKTGRTTGWPKPELHPCTVGPPATEASASARLRASARGSSGTDHRSVPAPGFSSDGCRAQFGAIPATKSFKEWGEDKGMLIAS